MCSTKMSGGRGEVLMLSLDRKALIIRSQLPFVIRYTVAFTNYAANS